IERKAADDELLRGVAEAERGAHRRVVLEHRPERERLLVEDQRFAIGLDRERDLHRVLLAERAKRALPDDLRLILSLRGDDDALVLARELLGQPRRSEETT